MSPPESTAAQRPADSRIIALINQKGGVGKTTTTANLGAALRKAGRRVLLIDMDPQAHLTLSFGLDPAALDKTVYDLMVDPSVSAFEVAQQLEGDLVVLPAEVNLAGAESELAATEQAQQVLARKVAPLLESYGFDYVLLDCPPSLGVLTVNALALAREVIVPMQAHFLALQGLAKLLETVAMVRQAVNPQLVVSGIVLCMHEAQTVLAQEVLANLEEFLAQARGTDHPWAGAAVLEPPIRRNIKLAESPSFGQTIFDYAPYCPGARDYERLAESLMKQADTAVAAA